MLNITVCIGSSCHLKGSREIVKKLQELVRKEKLEESIELTGSFCMGQCVRGVCVTIDGILYSLSPEQTEGFFYKEVMGRLAP